MYKVLIVDDEKPVRQVVKALGRWNELGVGTLYEAVEGESALRVMREHKPDIILVDMKMPNMNGIEFLEAARKEFPQAKYIVISGYEDFEYTKQAIRHKVLDYLLKPVVEAELNEVLSKAVAELTEERKHKMENIRTNIVRNISIPMAKEKIMTSILENGCNMPLVEEYRKILGIEDTTNSLFGVTVLRIVNFDEVYSAKFRGDIHSAYFALINAIDELLSEWNKGFSLRNIRIKNEIILVITVPSMEESATGGFVKSKIREIIEKLEQVFGVYCIAGIGRFHEDFSKLGESYALAEEILNSVNILNCTDRVFMKRESILKAGRISIIDKKELLVHAFESGSIEYAKGVINDYFKGLRNTGFLSLEDLNKIAVEFIVIINNIVAHLCIKDEKDILSSCLDEVSSKSFARLEELNIYVLSIVEKVFHRVDTGMKASEKSNLYEIKEYIEKNFFKEIKLSFFSDRYYFSKEYLSKKFKEQFGYNIYEYVLKIRMEKAKELLKDTMLRIREISEYLGYKDNYYFSRAFKTYYGISPLDYRQKVLRDMNK